MRRGVELGVLGVLLLALPGVGEAFETVKYKGRSLTHPSPAITVHLNANGVNGVPAAQVTSTFQKAAANWAKIYCSNVTFRFVPYSGFAQPKDKKHSISFPPNFAGNNIFQTSYQFDTKFKFTDVDITMNPRTQWTTNPTGGGQDLESAAIVVLGHIMGLSSSMETKASMYGQFLTGDISKRTLHTDDIAGACTLYPSGQRVQCTSDANCPTGLGCQGSKCVEKPPTALPNNCKPCALTKDCGNSQLVCDIVGSGRACLHLCTPDGLCPTGFSCSGAGVGAQCLPTSGSCPSSSCTTDADCGGQKCKGGKCVPECSRDDECKDPSKPKCSNGVCSSAGSCTSDFDCKPGEQCKGGKCQGSGQKQPCTNDNECPANHTCKGGFCERSTPPPTCTNGQTQACKCPDGKAGTQTCANNAWGACGGCGGGQACTPGATQKCTCTNGKDGSQTCAADGKSWSACGGCGGGQPACTPGATQKCVCTNGKDGAQSCAADGTRWEACKCTGGSCTDGATQGCPCTGGGQGTQTCTGGQWGACGGCGGPPQKCASGATQACVCSNGQNGAQSCQADGTWAACQCQGTPPPPGDGGTTPPPTGDSGTTPPPAANCPNQTHEECPTGHFCVQGVCRPSGNNGGCDCSAHGRNSWQGAVPTLFVALFLLLLSIRRRV